MRALRAAAHFATGIVAVTVAPFPAESNSSSPLGYLILSLISRSPCPGEKAPKHCDWAKGQGNIGTTGNAKAALLAPSQARAFWQ